MVENDVFQGHKRKKIVIMEKTRVDCRKSMWTPSSSVHARLHPCYNSVRTLRAPNKGRQTAFHRHTPSLGEAFEQPPTRLGSSKSTTLN